MADPTMMTPVLVDPVPYRVTIDTTAIPRRPAHRPSRRHVVVDGAMGLFATIPVDEVTVQDIATAVEMTPAAVYYHFASKEQILTEGMQQFANQLLEEIRTQTPQPGDAGVGAMITHVLSWTIRRRAHATVYFVNSIGLNLVVEAVRREVREEMVDLLRDAVKTVRGRLSGAEAGVIAVTLVSLIETSLASILNQDSVYRGLGAKKSIAAVAAVADRVAGLSAA
jgi:AcrR family transcriptional regulator